MAIHFKPFVGERYRDPTQWGDGPAQRDPARQAALARFTKKLSTAAA